MANSSTCANGLCMTAREDDVFATGIAVTESSIEHPCDDFRVVVLVHIEALAKRDDVVIVDHQQSPRVIDQVKVARGRERLPRINGGILPSLTV